MPDRKTVPPGDCKTQRRPPKVEGASGNGGHDRAAQAEFAREVLEAARGPLLLLDDELRVIAANAPFYAAFALDAAQTEGRPLYDLGHGCWRIPHLRDALERKLPANGAFSDVEVEHEFDRAGPRTIALNGRRLDRLGQILLSIEDLTERRRAEQREWLLVAEIRHRANDILAAVRAMASRTYAGSRSLKDFWIRFDGRLQALATAQNLATQSAHERIGLHDLVTEELRVHAIREGDSVSVEGPEVEVTGKGAEALAMTVHELTTNAIEHGALAGGDGRLDIRWRIRGDHLEFDWLESVARRVRRPRGRGFGLDIIEEGTRYALGGEARVSFEPHGISCTLRFPLAPYATASREPDTGGPP